MILKLIIFAIAGIFIYKLLGGKLPAVPKPNAKPTLEYLEVSPDTVKEGQSYTVKFKASDKDGDELTYSVEVDGKEEARGTIAPGELGKEKEIELVAPTPIESDKDLEIKDIEIGTDILKDEAGNERSISTISITLQQGKEARE